MQQPDKKASAILRRTPLTDWASQFQPCDVNYWGETPHNNKSLWLVVVAMPAAAAAAPWYEQIDQAWHACESCWQALATRHDLRVAPDGTAGLLAAVTATGAASMGEQTLTEDLCEVVENLNSTVAAMHRENGALARSLVGMSEVLETTQAERDGVYRERAWLVALLAAHMPAWWADGLSTADYRVIVLDSPEGQLSWRITTKDLDLFTHVTQVNVARWDARSTTGEKYLRLARLINTDVTHRPTTTFVRGDVGATHSGVHPDAPLFAQMVDGEPTEHLAYNPATDRLETGGDEVEFADEGEAGPDAHGG